MHVASFFVFDMVVPAMEPVIGLPAVIAAFFAVIVLEGVLLKLLRWDASWVRCFLYSLAINVVTTLVGVLASLLSPQPLLSPYGEPAQILFVLVALFIASVMIEGIELQLLNKKGPSPFKNALILNAASYALLVALVILGVR
jgi:hypothetical protein